MLLLTWPFSAFPQQARLFELLSSDRTGIDFANLVEDNDSMNIISHPNHWNGGGVAIGDFDNDGLPDIYFSGNTVPDRVYKNLGELRFKDITETAGVNGSGGWRTGVSLVDINNDGWMDIYVCRAGPNYFEESTSTNLLFVNNGDLTFTEQAQTYGVDDSGLSIHAVFFDMDNDGDQDLFVINNNHELSFGSNIYSDRNDARGINKLYRNDGHGFTEIGADAGIIQTNALSLNAVASDLNGDGLKDIYVSNDLVNSDHVYLNLGDGVFQERGREMFKHYSMNAMGSDLADVNNDGFIDVFVVDMFPKNAERQKNQAGITNDYFESMVKQGHHPQHVRNSLFINNGDSTFSDIAYLAGVAHTDWSWCPLIADFDNDGFKDILVTNSLLKNILDNDFRVYKMDSIVRFSRSNVKTALYRELDKTESLHLRNFIFQGQDGIRFDEKTDVWGLGIDVNTTSAAHADLDGDGDLDLVLNNLDTVSFIFKNNVETLTDHSFLRFKSSVECQVWVYQDGSTQFQEKVGSRGYQSFPENIVHFGLKTSRTVDSVYISTGANYGTILYDVVPGRTIDVDSLIFYNGFSTRGRVGATDRKLFVERFGNSFIDYEHVENAFDDFKREPLLYEKHSQPGPFSCQGDINKDGLQDMYVSGALGIEGSLFIQNKSGSFSREEQPSIALDADHEDGACLFFDSNSDGWTDLYISSCGYELQEDSKLFEDRLYVNDGHGQLIRDTVALPGLFFNSSCVATADYDGDGDLDLFVGGGPIPNKYPLSYPSKLLRNRLGRFEDVTDKLASSLNDLGVVKDAIWTDYDNDGSEDLIVVGHWMPITVLSTRGKKLKLVENSNLEMRSGFWNSIDKIQDGDDGKTKYIVGNRGLNGRLQGNLNEPVRLYHSDFDINGVSESVLTYYIEGTEAVIHSRDVMLDQLIYLKKKFLSYKDYAKASIEDIFSDEELAVSRKFEITELRTSLIQHIGESKFSITPLDVNAQKFPVRDAAIFDLGEDDEGVILVGNSSDVHFSFGKEDAGNGCVLLFENNRIRPLDQSSSGLKFKGVISSIEKISTPEKTIFVGFEQFGRPQVFQLK